MKQPAKWGRNFLPLASAGRRPNWATAACLPRSPRRPGFSWTTPSPFRLTPNSTGNDAPNIAHPECGASAVLACPAGSRASQIGLNMISLDLACPPASNGRRRAGPLNHQGKFTVK